MSNKNTNQSIADKALNLLTTIEHLPPRQMALNVSRIYLHYTATDHFQQCLAASDREDFIMTVERLVLFLQVLQSSSDDMPHQSQREEVQS